MACANLGNAALAAILFDFAAAFPSVEHRWIWRVMSRTGIPEVTIGAIQQLFAENLTSVLRGGHVYPGFAITCGIRQGCPLSGVLFVILFDPCIGLFHLSFPGLKCCVRAVADDIAAARSDFRYLLPQGYVHLGPDQVLHGSLPKYLRSALLCHCGPMRSPDLMGG